MIVYIVIVTALIILYPTNVQVRVLNKDIIQYYVIGLLEPPPHILHV